MSIYKFIIFLAILLSTSVAEAGGIVGGNQTAYIDNPDLAFINAEDVNFAATYANPAPDLSESTGLTGQVWSEALGWISFNGTHYGVEINCNSDTQTGVLTGLAWGEGSGFINFQPTRGGVTLDSNGVLDGSAWVSNAGWLVFDSSVGPGNPGYVQFDFACESDRGSSHDSSGSGIRYVCKDSDAINYNNSIFARHKQSLCKYDQDQMITYACKDKNAINYKNNSIYSHKVSLCEYNDTTPEVVPEKSSKIDEWTEGKTCHYFTQYVAKGDRDGYIGQEKQQPGVPALISEIKSIQEVLNILGYNAGDEDGIFGAQTEQAVNRFQSAYFDTVLKPWSLTQPTGRFYQSTRVRLNEVLGCDDSVTLDNGIFVD